MQEEMERFAALLADLIEKYVDKMDLDNLPDPPPRPTADKVVGVFLWKWFFTCSNRYHMVL